jgi:hypothetical protein
MTTVIPLLARKLFLMTVLLLAPGVSFAVEEVAPVPGTETPAPLHLVNTAEAEQRPHGALRVAAEVGGLAVTSAALAGLGLGAGLELGGLDGAAYGMFLGLILGAPLGTWWAGSLVGGEGTLGGAFLGAGVGVLAGALATLAVYNDDAKVFCYPIGAMVGAIIGYEISDGMELRAKRSAASASFQPVVAVSGNGAVLGLSGRF